MTSFLCIVSPDGAGLRRVDVSAIPELFAPVDEDAPQESPRWEPLFQAAAAWRAAKAAMHETLSLLRREAEERRRQTRPVARTFTA